MENKNREKFSEGSEGFLAHLMIPRFDPQARGARNFYRNPQKFDVLALQKRQENDVSSKQGTSAENKNFSEIYEARNNQRDDEEEEIHVNTENSKQIRKASKNHLFDEDTVKNENVVEKGERNTEDVKKKLEGEDSTEDVKKKRKSEDSTEDVKKKRKSEDSIDLKKKQKGEDATEDLKKKQKKRKNDEDEAELPSLGKNVVKFTKNDEKKKKSSAESREKSKRRTKEASSLQEDAAEDYPPSTLLEDPERLDFPALSSINQSIQCTSSSSSSADQEIPPTAPVEEKSLKKLRGGKTKSSKKGIKHPNPADAQHTNQALAQEAIGAAQASQEETVKSVNSREDGSMKEPKVVASLSRLRDIFGAAITCVRSPVNARGGATNNAQGYKSSCGINSVEADGVLKKQSECDESVEDADLADISISGIASRKIADMVSSVSASSSSTLSSSASSSSSSTLSSSAVAHLHPPLSVKKDLADSTLKTFEQGTNTAKNLDEAALAWARSLRSEAQPVTQKKRPLEDAGIQSVGADRGGVQFGLQEAEKSGIGANSELLRGGERPWMMRKRLVEPLPRIGNLWGCLDIFHSYPEEILGTQSWLLERRRDLMLEMKKKHKTASRNIQKKRFLSR